MGTQTTNKTDRRLLRALEYVSDYWLPISPDVARRVREGIDGGIYDSDRLLLKQEICSDLGLFFGCIRELRTMLSPLQEQLFTSPDLTQVFEGLDISTLQTALNAVMTSPAVHLLGEGEDPEVSRLLESVISITAAHSLAGSYDATPGAAASAAALRQLGYALVAWNYPGVYRDSLEKLASAPHATLDTLLTSALGYSPSLLATSLASKWGLPQELIECSHLTPEGGEDEEIISAIGASLRTICRVSEQLSRAQFPDLYPSAKDDWEAARKEVAQKLGPQGIQKIQQRCAVACASFLASSPDIFRPGLLLDDTALQNCHSDGCNPYIPKSLPAVQSKLTQLYEIIEEQHASSQALQFLVRELIPEAQFTGGCVYTVDPTSCSLIPQLDIGPCEARSISSIPYMVNSAEEDPVLLAFLTADGCKPVIVENNRDGICSFAAAIGRGQRLGVLYLELPLSEMRHDPEHSVNHFHATLRALVDCLKL